MNGTSYAWIFCSEDQQRSIIDILEHKQHSECYYQKAFIHFVDRPGSKPSGYLEEHLRHVLQWAVFIRKGKPSWNDTKMTNLFFAENNRRDLALNKFAKPDKFIKQLIQLFAKPQGRMLDAFAGSCSSIPGAFANRLNHITLIDKDANQIHSFKHRLSNTAYLLTNDSRFKFEDTSYAASINHQKKYEKYLKKYNFIVNSKDTIITVKSIVEKIKNIPQRSLKVKNLEAEDTEKLFEDLKKYQEEGKFEFFEGTDEELQDLFTELVYPGRIRDEMKSSKHELEKKQKFEKFMVINSSDLNALFYPSIELYSKQKDVSDLIEFEAEKSGEDHSDTEEEESERESDTEFIDDRSNSEIEKE